MAYADEPEAEPEERPEPEDEVPLDDEEEGEKPSELEDYDDDEPNLVPKLLKSKEGEEYLKKLAQDIKRKFDDAFESSAAWRDKLAKNLLIFSGALPSKDFPFKDCANMHVPIMLETITRLHFRAQAELFGDWSNVFGVMPVGPDDEVIAELLSKHGNWQINEEIPDFKRQMDRAMLMYFLHGDLTLHSTYDLRTATNRHEALTPDEFVTPYTYTTTMPDYSDCPYYFRVRMYYEHELEALRESWHDVDAVLEKKPPPWDSDPEQPIRVAAAEAKGEQPPDGSDGATYKILHYEGWEEIPKNKLDRRRWVQAHYDYASGNLLALFIHEEPDWQELREYEKRVEEQQSYLNAVEAFPDVMAQYQAMVSMPPPPSIDPMTGMAMPPPPPPPPPTPPVMPMWMDPDDPTAEPEQPTMRPIYLFSHGVCVEPLAGNLGLGFGAIEADFNRAANTALNQFTDAATLNNARGLITSKLVTFSKDFTYRPGAVNQVEGVSGAELKNNIMPLEFGPPSEGLIQVVDKAYAWGQSAVQSPNVLSGEPGKSGETFRGIATRVEQATKQLSVSTRKFADGPLTQVLKNNARLNGIYGKDSQFIAVNNHRLGKVEMINIGREMYRRDYKVAIRADLKFSSDAQRIADAEQMLQIVLANPMLAQNVGLIQRCYRKVFEARQQYDLIDFLGPQQPPPPVPLGFMPPPPAPPGAAPQGGPPGQPPGGNGPSGPAPEGPPQ